MKAAKLRNVKAKKEIENNKDEYSIQSMLKIILIIILILGIFYLITYFWVKNKKEEKRESYTVIDTSKILLNGLLSKPESEYYVLATMPSKYDSSYQILNYNRLYDEYVNKYKQQEDALVFYYIDLDDALNKNYLSDETIISNDLSELKVSDEVLFRIENSEIIDYYIGSEEIIDALSDLGE